MTRTNRTSHWEFLTNDGTLVVKTCRDTLGGFARVVREVEDEFGGFVWQTVDGHRVAAVRVHKL